MTQFAKSEPEMLAKFVILWYNIRDYKNYSEARFMINIRKLESGFFAIQHSAGKPTSSSWDYTVSRMKQIWNIEY